MPYLEIISTASSTVEYWTGNWSLSIPSFTLDPNGAERCRIILHLPFFFGMTPRPEDLKVFMGMVANGPSTLPASTSIAGSAVMMCGC